MLAIDNPTSRYGRIEMLHGVSCEVRQGEIVTLVGSNGAGKSTLLRAISGVQPVASGSIRLDGQVIMETVRITMSGSGATLLDDERVRLADLGVESQPA